MSSDSRPNAGGATPTYLYNADRRRGDWRGKWRELHPLLYVVAALFVVYFARGPISDLVS